MGLLDSPVRGGKERQANEALRAMASENREKYPVHGTGVAKLEHLLEVWAKKNPARLESLGVSNDAGAAENTSCSQRGRW